LPVPPRDEDLDVPLPTTNSNDDIPSRPSTPDFQPTAVRRSTRVPLPSTAVLESKDYQQREVASRREGHDWATNRPRAALVASDLEAFTVELNDYTACLAETKASHHIPHSYQHAISSDPE
jgi:hypothetical protein